MKTITINSLSELPLAAELLDKQLKQTGSNVVAFYGSMGAGKTTLIREYCKLRGVDDSVSSPTFALVNEYLGADGEPIFHFDFYRINRLEEVYDLGYEEYFYGKGVCLVEWAELVEELLPEDALSLKIELVDKDSREISIGD